MRDFKGMKRQRGRNRGGGGSGGGGGGGGKPQQHNANRAFESNGPDNLKIRGHAQHVFEKYQQLARDATSAGDRVLGESLLQHAEHYFRVLRTLQPNRPYTDFIGREGFASGYDIDFEDEMGESDEGETANEGGESTSSDERGDYAPRDGQSRDGQNRDNQSRDNQSRDNQGRDNQSRDNQNRDGQNRDGQNRDNQNRDNQNRDGQNRDGQPREQRWDNRSDQTRSDNNRQDGRQDARGDRGYNNNGNNNANGAGRNRDRSFNRDQPRDDRNFNRDQPRDAARDQPRDRGEGRWENRGEGQDGEASRYERRDRGYESREARDAQRDPLPVVEPQAQPLTREPQPVEDRTPARETSPTDAPVRAPRVLRSRDGEESHAPAFLQSAASAPPASGEAEAPVKRPRGRPRKKVEETAPEEA